MCAGEGKGGGGGGGGMRLYKTEKVSRLFKNMRIIPLVLALALE